MDDTDLVFRALADSSRRLLLDRLFARNGQTLSELCEGIEMTRQAVTKHLRILEEANLIATRRNGRDKHHFLNPVPIHQIADRWISKYDRMHLRALADLKRSLESSEQEPDQEKINEP